MIIILFLGATFFIVSQISGERLEYCDSNDATRTSQINPTGKVAWVWALFFSYSMPEVLTFLTSLRTITMRTSSTPAVLEFLICLGFEVVHAVGVTILFFFALPGNSSVGVTILFFFALPGNSSVGVTILFFFALPGNSSVAS